MPSGPLAMRFVAPIRRPIITSTLPVAFIVALLPGSTPDQPACDPRTTPPPTVGQIRWTSDQIASRQSGPTPALQILATTGRFPQASDDAAGQEEQPDRQIQIGERNRDSRRLSEPGKVARERTDQQTDQRRCDKSTGEAS